MVDKVVNHETAADYNKPKGLVGAAKSLKVKQKKKNTYNYRTPYHKL